MLSRVQQTHVSVLHGYVIDCPLLFVDVPSDGVLVLSVKLAVVTTNNANDVHGYIKS